MVKKICEKIKDMEKIGKLKESKNYLQNESKLLLIYILIILFIINIVMIIFIYTEKRNLDIFKLKNNKEINYLKEQIKGLKNKQTETKKSENLIKKDFKEFDYLDYYLGKYNAFDLINEGLKKKLNKKIKSHKLIFKASRDGFKSKEFHKKCDWKSNTVTFILTKEGKIFGGFTDMSWDSESDAKEGSNGFIFSLNEREIFYNINLKFNIRCIPDYGPIFGNFDISLSDDCNINNKSYFSSYAYDTQGKVKAFSNNKNFVVDDFEIYELFLE